MFDIRNNNDFINISTFPTINDLNIFDLFNLGRLFNYHNFFKYLNPKSQDDDELSNNNVRQKENIQLKDFKPTTVGAT